MEVTAKLRYLRISPKKVRQVTDLLKGMSVSEAENQLKFTPKNAAGPVMKLLNSATANAENNFKLEKDNLYIKKVITNYGPTLHRWKPRAFGRATPIRKKSCHITLILDEKKVTKGKAAPKKGKKKEDLKTVTQDEVKKEAPKKEFQEVKKETKPISKMKEIKDKFIRRLGER